MTIKEEVMHGTEWDYSEIEEEVSDAIDLTLKKVEELIDEGFFIPVGNKNFYAIEEKVWEKIQQKLRGDGE